MQKEISSTYYQGPTTPDIMTHIVTKEIVRATARDGTWVIPATGQQWCHRSARALVPGLAQTRVSC